MAGHYIEDVHDVVRLIPPGRVTTYGAIADFLTLGSARMVGWALFQGVGAEDIPAHRVVNRRGELSGRHRFTPPSLMQERLHSEGVQVDNDMVIDFPSRFWSPNELLTL